MNNTNIFLVISIIYPWILLCHQIKSI